MVGPRLSFPIACHHQFQLAFSLKRSKKGSRALHFRAHRSESRRSEATIRSSPVAFLGFRGRTVNDGPAARLYDESARRNQARHLCISKLVQETPNVAVNGLLPDILPRLKIT